MIPLYKKLKYNHIIIKDYEDLIDMRNVFEKEKPKYACYDTEATGLNVLIDTPFMVIFGFNNFVYVCDNRDKGLFDNFIRTMLTLCKEEIILLFAHNAKFDRHMLFNNNTPIPYEIKLADTITIARLITPCDDDFASMKLADIGARYVDKDSKFGGELIKTILHRLKKERKKMVCDNYKLITGDTKFTDAWETYVKRINHITEYHEAFDDYKEPTYYDAYLESPEMFIDYAFDDVVIMLEFLKKAIPIYSHKYMRDGKVDNSIFFRENQLISDIGDVERNGFTIDLQYLIDSHFTVLKYKDDLYAKLEELTGETWRVGQHEKIKDYFRNSFDIDLVKSDKKAIKTLTESTDTTVKDVAGIIIQLRTVDKWLSTYIDGVLNKVLKIDGVYKLFTTINNNGTVSGRVSSDLQQMPKYAISDLNGVEIYSPRKMVIPSEGTMLVFADMSQIELRAQAYYTILSGEPDYNLCRAYEPYGCFNINTFETFDFTNPLHISSWKSGEWFNEDGTVWKATDLHSATTRKAFPELTDEDSDEFHKARYLGKMTNFSSNYGVGVKKLAEQLDCSIEIATKLRNSYNSTFPGVIAYGKATSKALALKGYVENLYGRKYYLDSSSNYYKANNYLIQGSCADGLKESEIRICKYLKDKKSKFIMAIHDELCIEVAKGEEYIIPVIREFMECMSDKMPYVPIVCDIEYTTTNWAEKLSWKE